MDPDEGSSPLSSFDFSSSFGLYSSDDDDDNGFTYRKLDKSIKEDVDAYIELELPPAAIAPPPSVSSPVATDEEEDDVDKELDFRISFSAIIPFPGFSPSSVDSTCDAYAQSTAAFDSSPQPAVESTLSRVHRRPINHSTISILPLTWTKFPLPIDDNCRRPVSDINGWKLLRSRGKCVKSSPAGNGGMKKLLLKLRSIVISSLGSMRASLAQAGIGAAESAPESRPNSAMKPIERWLKLCKPSERAMAVSSNGEMRSPSKVMVMRFEAVRKVFGGGVRQLRNNGIGKSGRLNESCPTSIKASPVHQSGGDASLVHAAIAHCKKSFGQNDDFSF